MDVDAGADPDRLLATLDPDQRAAVTAPPGPVVVVAGAGSGKTRVLATRIAHRTLTGSALAPHVVAFTFTRHAASELQRRLRDLGVHREVVAGTFHSVAWRILRRRWEDRGRRDTPTLLTNRIQVLSEVLNGDRRLAGLVAPEIDWARARLVTPEAYPAAAAAASRRAGVPPGRVAEIFRDLEAHKRKRRLLDFDDLLSECIAELRRPGVADAVAWWHRHLHVDEFQDINPLQFAFLEALRHRNDDLFVVGDPAQAIYGWNGADPTLLDRITEGALRPVVVRLATNYRSAPEVVAAADRVLAANRLGGDHVAVRPGGGTVVEHAAPDERHEAAAVVTLARDLRPVGAPWRSVAVLARTHELLRHLDAEFQRASIPTRIVSRDGRTPALPADVVRDARRSRSAEELHAWAVDLGWPSDEPATFGDPTALAAAVRAFERAGGGGGTAFAAWAALNDVGPGPDDDAVELVTMHAAKGREWAVVVVAGVDTGGLPVPASPRAPDRAEEARLLYVALTRARDRLAVTWSEQRGGRLTERNPLLPELVTTPTPSDETPLPPPPELVRRPTAPAPDPVLVGLTEWRARTAHAAGIPAAFVLDDATLRRVATARPRDVESLAAIEGVGPIAARRFAARLLPVIDAAG